ncbi:hypothetical protein FB451DRAFT_1207503 [Mycena latifolia]|nr:hypothetical protein FB451DRAFT_1207503 [Mycena latifolia]
MRIPSIPQRIPAPRVLIDRTGRASAQGLLSLFAALVFGFGFGLVVVLSFSPSIIFIRVSFLSSSISLVSLVCYIWSLPLYCFSAPCCCYGLFTYLLISLFKRGCNVTR